MKHKPGDVIPPRIQCRIYEAWVNDPDAKKIAKKYGVSSGSVYRIAQLFNARKHGFVLPTSRQIHN